MGEETISTKEANIRKQWRDAKLLDQIEGERETAEKYFLLDGPPYANYEPHVGHIRNTVYKDLYIRWAMLRGKKVLFQPGFDTHGLPIENMVEKKLNLTSKKDIQKTGIASFMKICRESAALNKDLWMEVYDKLGSWYSWKEPYLTYDNSYIQSTWWGFKQLWDKELAYEGKKPVFWCPSCETALAGYEATDSYKIVRDPSIYIKFPLKEEKDTYLVVYTTTPWTLPANVSVVIAGKEDYVKAKTKNHGTLILAKARVEKLLKQLEIEYEIIEEFKGETLVGKAYESLLDVELQRELAKNPVALKVLASIPILKERVGSKVAAKKGLKTGDIFEEFVSVEEGTGLVHCAPGHGKSDSELGKYYHLPALSPVDDQCKLTEDVAPFHGKFVKDADHDIADALDKTGRLLHYGTIEHSYPLCWRCKSPLIYRLSNQWFLKIDTLREAMLEANDKVEWQPEFAGERFAAWVANADDWNFSRQRYWGVPIPIWKGESGDAIAIGSMEELRTLATTKISEDFDLHAASEIRLKHPVTGEELTRVNDIFDVWFDSGSAPFASLGYPFKNKELFEEHYPINRINESQDQVRGWFYSLMFCNVGVFGKAPYKIVSMPGWVLDEKGDKMSKSQGNMVFAKDALEEFGADAIRLYYCWDVAPENTQKFNMDTIRNDIRKFFSIWTNLIKLSTTNGVTFSVKEVEAKNIEDEWILSRLHKTISSVRNDIEDFKLQLAGRSLVAFIVEDLSRTYIQLVRERMDNDETPAQIISHALWHISILAAAITPHQSEACYLALSAFVTEKELVKKSVHLDRLPEPAMQLVREDLEQAMELSGDVIAGILGARDKAQLGVRWPLEEVIVETEDEATQKAISLLQELIMRQTNLRKVKVESFPIKHDGKINFQALGKAFGQETGNAATCFAKNKEKIIAGITSKDKKITIDTFEFIPDYVNLEKIIPETHSAGEFKRGSVYLLKEANKDLQIEGYAREVTRRIQQLRKESGLEKNDRIQAIVAFPELATQVSTHKESIAQKIGADKLEIVAESSEKLPFEAETSIKGKTIKVMIAKI